MHSLLAFVVRKNILQFGAIGLSSGGRSLTAPQMHFNVNERHHCLQQLLALNANLFINSMRNGDIQLLCRQNIQENRVGRDLVIEAFDPTYTFKSHFILQH